MKNGFGVDCGLRHEAIESIAKTFDLNATN